MKHTKTELHTHLMGMLSAKSFLTLLKSFSNEVYWPLDKPITEDSKKVNIDLLLDNEDVLNMLQIKHGQTVPYDNLEQLYQTRTQLLKFAVQKMENKYGTLEKAERMVYSTYLNACLQELINQKVKYVEISYSLPRIMENVIINDDIAKKIECKFLLSTNRNRSLKKIKESANQLEKVLKKGIAVGFDIMGQELPLADIEKDDSNYSNNSQSFKRKLDILLTTLNQYKNSTLRIHSGETKESFANTEQILTYIDELATFYDLVIPPPEIRIGHGVYFNENDRYLSLLKKYNCIIEINASSNVALNNISSYAWLPYDYYIENDIPIVLSTDGHGLYDTSIPRENRISRTISRNYDKIVTTDQEIFERKAKK